MVTWGYMRKKGGVSVFLFLDVFFTGYFWPGPDTGNWPVQLKCLQMTLSLAKMHTSLSPWLSLVKDIFPFIGSFLSLLSQGYCCLTTGREGAMERESDGGEWEREKGRYGDNANDVRMGETKLEQKIKGKKQVCTLKLKPSLTVPTWNQYKDVLRSWMKEGIKGERICN